MFNSLTAASVFIGYRRADSGEWAGDLRTALQALGHDVFFDLTYLRASEKYRTVINQALDQCDVAVVVIEQDWATVTARHGRRRLDDPSDVQGHELARALSRD